MVPTGLFDQLPDQLLRLRLGRGKDFGKFSIEYAHCSWKIKVLHAFRNSSFPFQAIFQHIFNCAMNDLANQIATTQNFAIEFEDQGVNRLMSVKFWKGNTLCRVYVCRSGLPSSDLTGELGSLSRLLSVVSTKADIVACSGCPVELIRTIDYSAFFPRAVQSCFRFEHLQLQKMMHKPTFSVFGRIDFFSVLKCLIVPLGAATDEDWVLQSPELARVSILSSHMRRKG